MNHINDVRTLSGINKQSSRRQTSTYQLLREIPTRDALGADLILSASTSSLETIETSESLHLNHKSRLLGRSRPTRVDEIMAPRWRRPPMYENGGELIFFVPFVRPEFFKLRL